MKITRRIDRCSRTRSTASTVLMGLAFWLSLTSSSFADCLDQDADLTTLASQKTSGEELDRMIHRAEQAMRIGYREQAIQLLEAVAREARRQGHKRRQAISLGALGNGHLVGNRPFEAWKCLEESLAVARDLGSDDLISLAYLNLANYQATLGGDRQVAEVNFARAIASAEKASRADLAIKARLNRSYIQLRRSQIDDLIVNAAVDDLESAERDIPSIDSDLAKTSLWLAVGQRWSDVFASSFAEDRFAERAQQAIKAALDGARKAGRRDIEASSLGAMGQLYEQAGRSTDALDLYRQAEAIVRFSDSPSGAYPWSWRMARLLAEIGNRGEAVEAYKRAVTMTEAIRRSTADVEGHPDFTPTVLEDTQLLLGEYLELLFNERGDGAGVRDLETIRGIVEQQREVEVQTFFQDDCIADLRSRIKDVDQNLDSKTALIYPVALKRAWILLVEIDDELTSVRLDTTPESLAQLAYDLRDALQDEKDDPDGYLALSRSLHRLLIEPIGSRLRDHEVDTLVFVPSGPLRSIPFAALHDGSNFLIRSYAVATVPGLSLLDSRPAASLSPRALIGGLTTTAEGYAALPNVPLEIERIRSSIPVDAVLAGADFVPTKLKRTLDVAPYNVVHVASHAKIGANAAESFIVTHGGMKLGLDLLEDLLKSSSYRDQPVELLTLSACQTADGVDQDRAALGLAGIAVKSGARSAIGTLWPVFDRSSPILMGALYDALGSGDSSMTKAKALQRAQISLLDDEAFNHPIYWAPYLLIGSWR